MAGNCLRSLSHASTAYEPHKPGKRFHAHASVVIFEHVVRTLVVLGKRRANDTARPEVAAMCSSDLFRPGRTL
eukprot:SAG11_NODE_64_length_18817_cov_64.238327_19_plen_73_part_00